MTGVQTCALPILSIALLYTISTCGDVDIQPVCRAYPPKTVFTKAKGDKNNTIPSRLTSSVAQTDALPLQWLGNVGRKPRPAYPFSLSISLSLFILHFPYSAKQHHLLSNT